MNLIEARGLTRSFGSVQAVQGLDLDVADGELVAFLGPNGAGKSTSLRMLTTLLAPTSGTATVAGCDIATDPGGVRRRPVATDVTVTDRTLTARVEDGPAALPALLRAEPEVAVETAEVRRATLDDVFLALTGRSLRESAAGPADTATSDTATSEIPEA
jgi:ABC-type branched-subunit amino acid transport system ATPase component